MTAAFVQWLVFRVFEAGAELETFPVPDHPDDAVVARSFGMPVELVRSMTADAFDLAGGRASASEIESHLLREVGP
jgi:hypothetical protein